MSQCTCFNLEAGTLDSVLILDILNFSKILLQFYNFFQNFKKGFELRSWKLPFLILPCLVFFYL